MILLLSNSKYTAAVRTQGISNTLNLSSIPWLSFYVATLTALFLVSCGNEAPGTPSSGTDPDTSSVTSDTDSDSDSNTDTASETESDTATDTSPVDEYYQWHTFYNSEGGWEYGRDIAIDNDGDLVIVGDSTGVLVGPDGEPPLYLAPESAYYTTFVVKTDPQGNHQWHVMYGDYWDSEATAVTIDEEGNIIVTGDTHFMLGPNGEPPLNPQLPDEDLSVPQSYVLKLSPDGDYLWHTIYGGPRTDYNNDVVCDGEGNVIAVGASVDSWVGPNGEPPLNPHPETSGSGSKANSIAKFGPLGDYKWHTFYSGYEDAVLTESNGVEVTSADNIVIVGTTCEYWNGPEGQQPIYPYSDGNQNMFLLALAPSGDYLWHAFYVDGPEMAVFGFSIDSNDNIYVSGTSGFWTGPDGQLPLNSNLEESWDAFVLKLDSEGNYLWHTLYGSGPPTNGQDDAAYAVSATSTDSILLAGYAYDPWLGPEGQSPLNEHSGKQNMEIMLMSLDSDGLYQWHSFYGSPVNENPFLVRDLVHGIAVDNNGSIFVTGISELPWDGPSDQPPLNEHDGGDDMFILALQTK